MYDILNPYNSDVALYGKKPGLKRPGLQFSIFVAGCAIGVCERRNILGVTLDATISFDDHFTSVIRACNFHCAPSATSSAASHKTSQIP